MLIPPLRLAPLALALLSAVAATAQLTPEEAVAAMGRGINLGNTLEPPLEGGWNNGPAEESYFDAYVEAGFGNVRIPVRWDRHTARAAPFRIDEVWMDRVEEVVDWALGRDLYVVLNGHHEDWLKNGYADPQLRARYDSIWVQISERFGEKPDRLLYEIINEPFGMTRAQVDDLNERVLGLIREREPTRLVVFGGDQYSNADELLRAAIPGGGDDDYLVGYYHAYDPYLFGLEGQGRWGSANDYREVEAKVGRVKAWSERTGVPVHLSEFGAVRRADYNSRMRFYAAYVEAAVSAGFAFSAWDDGGDFRILERGAGTWPEVKDILVHTHADSPDRVTADLGPQGEGPVRLRWRNRAAATSEIRVERSVNGGAFEPLATVPADATAYEDPSTAAGGVYTYRLFTDRSADGTLLHGYPVRVDRTSRRGIVNYADELTDAGDQFAGNPTGVDFAVEGGVLSIVGDGTSGPYETVTYALRDATGNAAAADVFASNEKLYVSARTRSGRPANLRIDLVDGSRYATTEPATLQTISGDEFVTYVFDFANTYNDGAYGGTGCTQGGPSCAVDGASVEALAFYPEPGVGGFAEAIEVDWLSFGQSLTLGITAPERLSGLSIAPNPATAYATVTYALEAPAKTRLSVLDPFGRVVAGAPSRASAAGERRETVDVSALPGGGYVVRIEVDGVVAGSRRLVVE